jgi:hypothetical protein
MQPEAQSHPRPWWQFESGQSGNLAGSLSAAARRARGITLRIVGARGRVRDLLRANGIAEKIRGLDRVVTLDSLLWRCRQVVRPWELPDGSTSAGWQEPIESRISRQSLPSRLSDEPRSSAAAGRH